MTCCSHCGKTGDGDALMRCGRCKQDSYCGAECQRARWKVHKKSCSVPQPGRCAGESARPGFGLAGGAQVAGAHGRAAGGSAGWHVRIHPEKIFHSFQHWDGKDGDDDGWDGRNGEDDTGCESE
mmetsp:Transcript_71682/g.164280  ORF Transcript_71682/g.164280 Transcript_71682/m.164280 type:complete len:124 (+) Transcript_71682:167-538(+)